jgi:hypothetical protein
MATQKGIQNILDALQKLEGQHASIIDAEPFFRLIRAAFTDIPPGYVGHALLYNLSMQTVADPRRWKLFQDVWLTTYGDNTDVESVYILLPVEDERTLKPCRWTSVAGLCSMVKGYQTRTDEFPSDLPRLRRLCRKTYFCVVPYNQAKQNTTGVYTFCLYLVLPKKVNLLDVLERCVQGRPRDRAVAVSEIVAGVRLILGAGIDSPYSSNISSGSSREYDYKFIIVIPHVTHVPKKDPCIIKEHAGLFADLWASRVPLKIPTNAVDYLYHDLSCLDPKIYGDSAGARCVALDFAFLWYHFFLNAKTRRLRPTPDATKKNIDAARRFIEHIRGGFPGTITDESLKTELKTLLTQKTLRLADKRRIGDFVMADDSNWRKVEGFVTAMMDIINRLKKGEKFKEKQVGFRLWGKASSGKTFLIKQLKKHAFRAGAIRVMEPQVGLERATRDQIQAWVKEVHTASKKKTVLAFVDEVEKAASDSEVYEALFRLPKVVEDKPSSKVVFLIAGSSGRGMDDMEKAILQHTAGDDLLERTKVDRLSFPDYSISDRIYIAAARILKKSNGKLNQIDLLALVVLAVSPLYSVADFDNLIDNAIRKATAKGEKKILLKHVLPNEAAERELFEKLYPKTYPLVSSYMLTIVDK